MNKAAELYLQLKDPYLSKEKQVELFDRLKSICLANIQKKDPQEKSEEKLVTICSREESQSALFYLCELVYQDRLILLSTEISELFQILDSTETSNPIKEKASQLDANQIMQKNYIENQKHIQNFYQKFKTDTEYNFILQEASSEVLDRRIHMQAWQNQEKHHAKLCKNFQKSYDLALEHYTYPSVYRPNIVNGDNQKLFELITQEIFSRQELTSFMWMLDDFIYDKKLNQYRLPDLFIEVINHVYWKFYENAFNEAGLVSSDSIYFSPSFRKNLESAAHLFYDHLSPPLQSLFFVNKLKNLLNAYETALSKNQNIKEHLDNIDKCLQKCFEHESEELYQFLFAHLQRRISAPEQTMNTNDFISVLIRFLLNHQSKSSQIQQRIFAQLALLPTSQIKNTEEQAGSFPFENQLIKSLDIGFDGSVRDRYLANIAFTYLGANNFDESQTVRAIILYLKQLDKYLNNPKVQQRFQNLLSSSQNLRSLKNFILENNEFLTDIIDIFLSLKSNENIFSQKSLVARLAGIKILSDLTQVYQASITKDFLPGDKYTQTILDFYEKIIENKKNILEEINKLKDVGDKDSHLYHRRYFYFMKYENEELNVDTGKFEKIIDIKFLESCYFAAISGHEEALETLRQYAAFDENKNLTELQKSARFLYAKYLQKKGDNDGANRILTELVTKHHFYYAVTFQVVQFSLKKEGFVNLTEEYLLDNLFNCIDNIQPKDHLFEVARNTLILFSTRIKSKHDVYFDMFFKILTRWDKLFSDFEDKNNVEIKIKGNSFGYTFKFNNVLNILLKKFHKEISNNNNNNIDLNEYAALFKKIFKSNLDPEIFKVLYEYAAKNKFTEEHKSLQGFCNYFGNDALKNLILESNFQWTFDLTQDNWFEPEKVISILEALNLNTTTQLFALNALKKFAEYSEINEVNEQNLNSILLAIMANYKMAELYQNQVNENCATNLDQAMIHIKKASALKVQLEKIIESTSEQQSSSQQSSDQPLQKQAEQYLKKVESSRYTDTSYNVIAKCLSKKPKALKNNPEIIAEIKEVSAIAYQTQLIILLIYEYRKLSRDLEHMGNKDQYFGLKKKLTENKRKAILKHLEDLLPTKSHSEECNQSLSKNFQILTLLNTRESLVAKCNEISLVLKEANNTNKKSYRELQKEVQNLLKDSTAMQKQRDGFFSKLHKRSGFQSRVLKFQNALNGSPNVIMFKKKNDGDRPVLYLPITSI